MHITDRYIFLKILVFLICFVFYKYCILVFDLLRGITDIRIFRFESKRIKNRIKNLQIFFPAYP